jgi:hypothetical protein
LYYKSVQEIELPEEYSLPEDFIEELYDAIIPQANSLLNNATSSPQKMKELLLMLDKEQN